MKKKLYLVFSSVFLLAGLLVPMKGDKAAHSANATQTTEESLKSLIASFKGEGSYTKKTTIALNSDTVLEMSGCFHCNETASKRTTYYTPNKLLLASEDGSIPVGSGSYQYVDGEVKRASALADTTEDNMWDNLSTPVSVGQLNATKLEDYYVTLDTFLNADYFDNWVKDGNQYYYNLSGDELTKNSEDVYNCDVWNDFLYFCAPMLYKNSGRYFSAKSLTIKTKYDGNGEEYLCLDMYLADGDSGKLTESYLAEARIYKGNKVFEEDLNKAFFLVSNDNKMKFNVDPNNNTHLVISDVSMSKGTAVKVWDTENNYYGSSRGMEHNLSIEVNVDTGLIDSEENYVIPEDARYDFFVDFNGDGSYKKLYVFDREAMTLFMDSGEWGDVDENNQWCRYYDKDGNEITNDSFKPRVTLSDWNNGFPITYIVVPKEAAYLQICYNKYFDPEEYVVTALLEIKYPEFNCFQFDQWNGGNENITFIYKNYSPEKQ